MFFSSVDCGGSEVASARKSSPLLKGGRSRSVQYVTTLCQVISNPVELGDPRASDYVGSFRGRDRNHF